MKTFARLFFVTGALLGLYIWIFPDALKFVSIPADDSVLKMQQARQVTQESTIPVANTGEKVDLVVNGVPYVFHLASVDAEHIYQEARTFCQSNSESWNLAGDALEKGCTQVLFNNLSLKVKEIREARVSSPSVASTAANEPAAVAESSTSTVYDIKVPVTNGKTYAIKFDATVHTPFQVSEHFCRENAAALGLESELHITQGCVPSVGQYIAEQLQLAGFVAPTTPPQPVQ